MMASGASSTNDKTAVLHPDPKPSKGGFFSRKKQLDEEVKEKNADIATEVKTEEKEVVAPVPFGQLFRYSTIFELVLDFIGIIAAVGAGAAQPLMSLLFGRLVQDFVNFQIVLVLAQAGDLAAKEKIPQAAAAFRNSASQNAIWLVVIGLGMFVCTYVYMNIWVYTGEVNAKRIREKYLKAILRQDIAFFDKVGAGEVATRIQTDTHLVQQGISEKVALVVHFFASFITGFVLAYSVNWRLALALSAMLPCIGITGAIMSKFLSSYMQLSLKHVAEAGSIAEEVISTIRTAQAFGTQRLLAVLYNDRIEKGLGVSLKAAKVHGVALSFFFFFIYGGYALAFSFGTTLINQGRANAGQIVNVLFAILFGSLSLVLAAPEVQAVINARGAAAKLYETIDRIPDIDSADPNGQKLDNVKGEITLEGVKFSYPSRSTVQVVKGLSLTFKAGKTAALVGASGSGKSTIISLVERFYDPTDGAVKLDGHDLKDLNLKWLRNQIGLVSQEPILFATTISNNVAHGLIGTPYENSPEQEKDVLIKEACVKANADGFILNLPDGYNTMVGERGFLLSGGQKQRVAIARAIVSDPRILLLDEATSALDTQSEGIVQDALDKAAAGRTTITIAHRLSTIKDADVIHVLGDGLVLESGTHNELLALNGAYSKFVQAQRLREGQEQDSVEGSELGSQEDLEKVAREEIPLGKRSTRQSLASEILEEKRKAEASKKKHDDEDDYGLAYLFWRMSILVRDQWRNYIIGSLFACITGMVYPAFGIVFSKGIEGFSKIDPRERRHDGDRIALWLFVIAMLSTASIGSQNYLFGSAASTLTTRLRMLSFKALLRQDVEFFDQDKNNTGTLTAQLSENPQKVNGLAGVTLGAIVQSIATVISGSILGLVFIWKVGLVGVACVPLLISTGYIRLVCRVMDVMTPDIPRRLAQRVVVLKDQANKKAHEDSAQLACEAAASIRTVAPLTREDDCLKLYSKSLEEPLRRSNRSAIWSNLLYGFTQAQAFFIIALIFWYGSVLVSRQEASMFAFFIALMSTILGAIQAGNVFIFVPDMSSAKGAGSDIIKLLDSKAEIDAESTEGKVVDQKTIKGHIRFEDVHFRYPTRPGVRVLRNLSLEVEPGTYVALVGASGSGKSTTIQLIERFYDPFAGDIYFDGEKITELNVTEYRKNLALVSQEPTLYAGTVKFNVLLGATKPIEEVTQEEIETACRDANILQFIQELPNGFDTEVGGKGSQLSGGQKQRIAIARALLRNPKVLLLDEATSALDSTSEKVVQAALDQAAKGRTTIAIAHRLSTIQNADKIYFIKEGRVSESGTHDQLIAKRGDYYEYVQLQDLNKHE